MRNKIIAGLICSLFLTATYGQEKHRDRQGKIETLKIAYITKQLDLKPEESQVFWPIYNEYNKEKKAARKICHTNKELPANEDEARESIACILKMEQKQLALKEKYVASLSDKMSYERIYLLFAAEKNFKKNVLSEMSQRKRKRKSRPE